MSDDKTEPPLSDQNIVVMVLKLARYALLIHSQLTTLVVIAKTLNAGEKNNQIDKYIKEIEDSLENQMRCLTLSLKASRLRLLRTSDG